MKVATTQDAKVTESMIRNAKSGGGRSERSVNKSTTVKRFSAAASPSSTAPLRRSSRAARRRSLDCSQRGDSGMLRRIHRVSSAGNTPTRYIQRQALGPTEPSNNQTPEARRLPIPAPLCSNPPPLPRAWSGHSSETIDAPVAHSEPIPTPTRKRKTAKDSQFHANALSPVVSE